MLASTMLRKAAEIVEKTPYTAGACNILLGLFFSLPQQGRSLVFATAREYLALLKPGKNTSEQRFWFKTKEHRVLALLLASVIAKSEGQ